MDQIEKLITPEILSIVTDLSTRLSDETTDGSEQKEDTLSNRLLTTINAVQSMLKKDPQLVENTINKVAGSSSGLEGMGFTDIISTMASGIGGGSGGSTAENFQIESKSKLPFIEKSVLLPATTSEVEQGKKKKFKIKLYPDDTKKSTWEIVLEPGNYAYQFWHRSDDIENKPDVLVKIAVQEIVTKENIIN